jgi:tetratricopeptide (TPR) repeat protein
LLFACNGKYAVVMEVPQYRRRLALQAAFLFLAACNLVAFQTDDLALQSRQGKELMAEGRFEEAIGVYQKLVQALPGNPGILLNLGLAEQMAGHPSKAIPHFQSVLKAEPNNVPALTSLSMARLQVNQPAEAIPLLKKLLSLQPKDVNARGMLAGAEMSLDRFGDAAEQYRQLTSLESSDAKAWYGLGKAYESLAARSFGRLTKIAPESGYVAALLGDARVQQHQYQSAFFFYREAEKRAPQLPNIHQGLARVYRNTGHEDWAAAEEKEGQDVAPGCAAQTPRCRFVHGDFLGTVKLAAPATTPEALFWATKAYNELALQAFERLGQLPESVELHAVKAQIFHDHGQDREAANEWRAALALDPGDEHLKTELASSLFLAHDYQSAMPMIEALLAADPKSPDLNFMLGESLWRTQQSAKALPYLEAALRINPGMLPAHAALGLVLVSLDRNAEAIPHLEKAVTLDDDGSLHYSLARAYRAAGNADRARENMETYQKIQRQNNQVNEELARQAEITAPASK